MGDAELDLTASFSAVTLPFLCNWITCAVRRKTAARIDQYVIVPIASLIEPIGFDLS